MRAVFISTWDEFRRFVHTDEPSNDRKYWRGQRNPRWPLASTFERKLLAMGTGGQPVQMLYPYDGRLARDRFAPGTISDIRESYLQKFRVASAGLRGPHPARLKREKLWALGRHYGLTTPLLDWTDSPFVAAYFALSELLTEMLQSSGAPYGRDGVAIYRLLHTPGLCAPGDELRVVRPRVDELTRMHGQSGLFTWLESEDYFELQGYLEATGRGHLLTAVVLSSQALIDGMADLRLHAINPRTLFPDLAGAAMHANHEIEYGGIFAAGFQVPLKL